MDVRVQHPRMSSLDYLLDEVCPKCKPLFKLVLKRLDELERRLEKYENPHTPPSLRWKTVKKKPGGGRVGRPRGHEGVTRPQATPTESIPLTLAKCPHCRSRLGKPVKVESKIIEEIPEPRPVKVTEFLVRHYECKSCGEHVAASDSRCPREGVFGPRTLAHITLLKYHGRLPHRKVCETLEREFGLVVSPATVLDVTRRVSDSLREEYRQVIEDIRRSDVVYVDETGFKVSGVQFWLWAFTTETETLVVIRQSRGKKVLKEVLGKTYDGIIVCDGLRSYASYATRLQRCWSHILREVGHVAEKHEEAVPLCKALHRLYTKLVTVLETEPPPEKRKYLHRRALATLRRWTGRDYATEKVVKLADKIKTASKSMLTFVLHPYVEPTNNRVERALREHVVIRKIIGTLRNSKGTRIHETVMTMLATWKQQNLNPYLMIQKQIN